MLQQSVLGIRVARMSSCERVDRQNLAQNKLKMDEMVVILATNSIFLGSKVLKSMKWDRMGMDRARA